MESNVRKLNLTVVIPTYNRKEALIRLLKSLEKQNYKCINEFIISDNHSFYDVEKAIKEELPSEFVKLCRVIVNPVNIGGQGNINNCFLYPKTKWLWIVGDDDVVTNNALDILESDLDKYPDCAWFKYSTHNINAIEEECTIRTLHEFMEYYSNKVRHKGNLVFMSNNVYNMPLLSSYIIYAFNFSYTNVSQILPPLMGLDEGKIYIKYRKESICSFSKPSDEQQWDCLRIFLGVSTIEDITFESLTRKEVLSLKNILVFWSLKAFIVQCLKQNYRDVNKIKKVYKALFVNTGNCVDKCLYYLLLFQLKYRIPILSKIYKMHKIYMD